MFYYFCASLPSLTPGKSPKMSVADFDGLAREQVSPAEFELLRQCSLTVGRDPGESAGKPPVLAEMIRFEQYLRTRIAQRRSVKEDDKAAALPDPAEYFSEVDLGVAQAAAAADPAEREKLIDRIRWRRLDDLEVGHEFDFEQLCIYRMRLSILDKYRSRNADAGREIFNAAVDRISSEAPAPEQQTHTSMSKGA